MNIVVTGVGYVGIVTAACLAESGHHVTCVELDFSKVERLKAGDPIIYEPGLKELMEKNKSRLEYIADGSEAYRNADVIFICVGTPERRDGSANLTYVYDATKQVALTAQKDTVVVIKSTVPIGTCVKLEKYMNSIAKHKIEVVSNPEFLSQGTAVRDTFNAERIILGVNSENALEVMKQVYFGFKQQVVVTNRESSEMIKYASNDFLALKISYINEIGNFCEMVGANIDDVAFGMGLDSRIGNKFLNAGIGYGGSCFPKDTKALHWLAKYHDYELKTIKAAIEVNENQKVRLLKKSKKYYSTLNGLTVAVLGLTFKPNTDDLREAPSLENIPLMLEDGAIVKAWDMAGTDNFKKVFGDTISYCDSIEETIENADLCLIFTEWDSVKNFPLNKYKELMKTPIVLDGRNCYSLRDAENADITYDSIGRKAVKANLVVKC